MNTYNVTARLVFEAESAEIAEEIANNALSLIPKGENPEYYEVVSVDKDRSSE